jgi:hypothetical protein
MPPQKRCLSGPRPVGAMTGMRVLVFGGRYFNDVPLLWRTLDKLHAYARISTIIDGASDDVTGPYIGADYWAHQWACAPAGPIRNRRMRDEAKPDLGVGFPGGRGTAGMADLLLAAGRW